MQREGGPIGLRSTASLANLIMKIWDTCWKFILEKENIDLLEYFRYVDDCRNFLKPLAEGWKWSRVNMRFEYTNTDYEQDMLSTETDQARTTRELVSAMSSICEFLLFEGEEPGMFVSNRLPTLDTEIWLDEESNKIFYAFFEYKVRLCCRNQV